MSKRRLLLAAALLLTAALAAIVAAAPRLLHLEAVRQRLAKELSEAAGVEIGFSRVEFSWLPQPCFRIRHVDISSAGADLAVPEIIAYPSLGLLFGDEEILRSLELVRPQIRLITGSHANGDKIPILPAASTAVRDAAVEIPRIPGWTTTPISIAGLDMDIREGGSSLGIKARARAGQGQDLRLSLFLDREKKKLRGRFSAKGLNPALLAPKALEGRIRLLNSPVDLDGVFEGEEGRLEMDINGSFPCFRYKSAHTGVTVECGAAEFGIHHDRRQTRIEIKRLDIDKPSLTLRGVIARKEDEDIPRWRIGLEAAGIDLGAVRQALLTLWPGHKVVATVCDIVAGGRATAGSFSFNGPAARFSHLEDMRITATVADADIHPPHTPLFLTNVSGTIRIEDGYLYGRGLTASLGNSRGNNGSMRLDLMNRDRAFSLGIGIDADLAALPSVLAELVGAGRFRDELSRFKQVSGRARARLELDGVLPHPLVWVEVKGFEANARYERLPWPVRLSGGKVAISPDKVSWEGVTGTAGPHRITRSAGDVSWRGGETHLHIEDSAAVIDGADLLATAGRIAGRKGKTASLLTSLSGPITVTGLNLAGKASSPSGWRYAMRIEARGLRWRSSMLPGEYLTERLMGDVSDSRIRVEESKTWSMEHPILLSADLFHHGFRMSDFRITMNGTVRKRLARWVTRQGWLPPGLVPATPMTLSDFTVARKSGRITVEGKILAGLGGTAATSAEIRLAAARGAIELERLALRGHGNEAVFSLSRKKLSGGAETILKWDGAADGRSAADLIAAPGLSFDRISGQGSMTVKPDAAPIMNGTIKADRVRFPPVTGIRTIIESAELHGKQDKGIEIKKLRLAHNGRPLSISGWLYPEDRPPAFDLTAKAGEASMADLGEMKDELPKSSGNGATGTFRFEFGRLNNIQGPVAGKGLSMRPARGELRITAGKWQTLKISGSRLCGLEFDGIFHPPGASQDSSFNLYSREGYMSAFEEVLPCLGFENDVINGRVAVDANLSGKIEKWRSGRLNLYSRKGVIHRLSLLSKALSLLNITGIISGSLIADLDRKGFSYSELEVRSHVEANRLIVDKAVIRGIGMNIFAHGRIDIATRDCDLVLLLAPLKTIDTILGNIPIIGRAMGGRDTAIVAVPVKLTGKIDNPEARILPAKEVGKGIANFIARTIKLPLAIFSPLAPKGTDQDKRATAESKLTR